MDWPGVLCQFRIPVLRLQMCLCYQYRQSTYPYPDYHHLFCIAKAHFPSMHEDHRLRFHSFDRHLTFHSFPKVAFKRFQNSLNDSSAFILQIIDDGIEFLHRYGVCSPVRGPLECVQTSTHIKRMFRVQALVTPFWIHSVVFPEMRQTYVVGGSVRVDAISTVDSNDKKLRFLRSWK